MYLNIIINIFILFLIFNSIQEITLWRKGERSRKLPLSGSLYQQQHALARHTAGEFPTEGIRTAPTPSLPPTPCLDSQSGFPGQRNPEPEQDHDTNQQKDGSREKEQEDVSTEQAQDDCSTEQTSKEDSSAQGSTEPSSIDKGSPEKSGADNSKTWNGEKSRTEIDDETSQGGAPPDIVSGTRDLTIQDGEEDTDSTKDLDVVSGGGGPPATPPEMLDSPPDMPSTPPDMIDVPSSPDFDLPDAPDSEPGSPQVQY